MDEKYGKQCNRSETTQWFRLNNRFSSSEAWYIRLPRYVIAKSYRNWCSLQTFAVHSLLRWKTPLWIECYIMMNWQFTRHRNKVVCYSKCKPVCQLHYTYVWHIFCSDMLYHVAHVCRFYILQSVVGATNFKWNQWNVSQATTILSAISLKSINLVISFHKILQNILVFSIIFWFDVFWDKSYSNQVSKYFSIYRWCLTTISSLVRRIGVGL